MLIQLCNLGRDAELRYTPGGKAVCNLALAYSIGWGNNKKTQWIDGALWGDRAEKLASHLTKGSKVLIYADDVELEEYQKNGGGTGSKIKCRINNIEFAGSAQQGQPPQQPVQQPQQPQTPAPPAPSGFDDFDEPPF